MRNRIIYNSEGLYVGPSPSSGYHFMTYDGELNNVDSNTIYTKNQSLNYHDRGDIFDPSFYELFTPQFGAVTYPQQIKDKNTPNYKRNHNLIKKIDRVQSIGYDFSLSRTSPSQLNKKGTIGEVIIEPQSVLLDFEYLIHGIRNEHRLGLNVNFPMFFYPFDGQPFYSGNEVFLFSGMTSNIRRHDPGQYLRGENYPPDKFTTILAPISPSGGNWQQSTLVPVDYNDDGERARRYIFPDNALTYPFAYRDTHNFFINIAPNGVDENSGLNFKEDLEHPFYQSTFEYYSAENNDVLAVGDCVLTSYKCSAAVGDFPRATLSYVGNNISYHVGASGNIPAVNPKDGELMTGKFVIPDSYVDDGAAALRPGDITLSVEASYLGFPLTGLNIDSYNFSINLNRSELRNLGHRLPVDRPIEFPIFCQGSFSVILNDYSTGSYVDLIREDSLVNLIINVASPDCIEKLNLQQGVFYPGVPPDNDYNILNYTVKKARITSIQQDSSIGRNKKAIVTFSVEMDPTDLSKGFFISGVNNTEKYFDYLAVEHMSGVESGDGLFLVTEDWEPLICGWSDV